MCDLCCTQINLIYHRVGETMLCSRCWRRYEQLIRAGIGRDDGHRLFILYTAHHGACPDCRPLRPVEWTDRRGIPYQANDYELDLALRVA